jgi:DNA repair protein RadC
VKDATTPDLFTLTARRTTAPKPKPKKDKATGHALHVYRCQLVEERTIPIARKSLASTKQAAEVFAAYIGGADREMFVVMLCDSDNSIVGMTTVAIGNTDAVPVRVRDVYKAAILRNAPRILVCHNHVSGDVKASSADKRLTRSLEKAGMILGIKLMDHVIVGPIGAKPFYSFLDEGLIKDG